LIKVDTMNGTAKQIEWAEKIKADNNGYYAEVADAARALAADGHKRAEHLVKLADKIDAAMDDASAWIDGRMGLYMFANAKGMKFSLAISAAENAVRLAQVQRELNEYDNNCGQS